MPAGIGVIGQIFDRAPDGSVILVIDFWQMLKRLKLRHRRAMLKQRHLDISQNIRRLIGAAIDQSIFKKIRKMTGVGLAASINKVAQQISPFSFYARILI